AVVATRAAALVTGRAHCRRARDVVVVVDVPSRAPSAPAARSALPDRAEVRPRQGSGRSLLPPHPAARTVSQPTARRPPVIRPAGVSAAGLRSGQHDAIPSVQVRATPELRAYVARYPASRLHLVS